MPVGRVQGGGVVPEASWYPKTGKNAKSSCKKKLHSYSTGGGGTPLLGAAGWKKGVSWLDLSGGRIPQLKKVLPWGGGYTLPQIITSKYSPPEGRTLTEELMPPKEARVAAKCCKGQTRGHTAAECNVSFCRFFCNSVTAPGQKQLCDTRRVKKY